MVDNFCDFLFAFWATKSLLKMVCRFLFRRETKHYNSTSPKTAFVSLKGQTACKRATVTHLQCTGLFQIILYIQAGSSGHLSFTEALCDRVHSTYNYCVENRKDFPTLSLFASWPGDILNVCGSNYPYPEHIAMVLRMFEPLNDDCRMSKTPFHVEILVMMFLEELRSTKCANNCERLEMKYLFWCMMPHWSNSLGTNRF